MTIRNICLATLVAASAAACAKSPESISPSYISDIGYRSLTCDQLGVESSRLNVALARAFEQQSQARTTDTVGVLLIGIPVSSFSGDNIAPEVARLKGEAEAVHRATLSKQCGLPPRPTGLNKVIQ